MKRLSAAMLLLLLSVVFTIGGSLAYDNAVNDTQTIQNGILVNRGQMDAVAASAQTTMTFSTESSDSQSDTMLFEEKWWEPGHVDAGVIKIDTSRNINYSITISKSDDTYSINNDSLASVIDVYYVPRNLTGLTRSDVINPENYKGSLSEFLSGSAAIDGTMNSSTTTQYITLALKMRETAGNSYQNLSLSKLCVCITATETNVTK